MQAIAVYEGGDEPVVVEKPRPEPAAGEALVRTLRGDSRDTRRAAGR
jgi:NADPH:quinone reductase-like Zn-dependent oxidoreductase